MSSVTTFNPGLDKNDLSAIAEGESINFLRGLGRVYQTRRSSKVYTRIGVGLLKKGIRPRKRK